MTERLENMKLIMHDWYWSYYITIQGVVIDHEVVRIIKGFIYPIIYSFNTAIFTKLSALLLKIVGRNLCNTTKQTH